MMDPDSITLVINVLLLIVAVVGLRLRIKDRKSQKNLPEEESEQE